MSPRKAGKTEKRPKKGKEARARREKRAEKKLRLRDQLAALTARVEALEAQVAELRATPNPSPQPAGDPLTAISGIGPRYAERLRATGIEGIADLVEADPKALAAQAGIPRKTIQGWIDAASAPA